jgi:2-keto-4-pentenoate hydratase/2-oxohepta-3-ene-1,7-dioic acid hydratase in catechol pathway
MKSRDTCAPMGPYLVTADEVPDPHALRVQL